MMLKKTDVIWLTIWKTVCLCLLSIFLNFVCYNLILIEKLSSSARRIHDQACRPGYDEAPHDGLALCQVQHARKKWKGFVQRKTSAQAHNSYVSFILFLIKSIKGEARAGFSGDLVLGNL